MEEETVALIAGGHTLKTHGAADPKPIHQSRTGSCRCEEQAWLENSFGTGNGINTISSGLEGAWTTTQLNGAMIILIICLVSNGN
jgi:catalase-peroxidase